MRWFVIERSDWKWVAAFVAVGLLTLGRVAATHRVFSAVVDEPTHIAAGYDWLTLGSTTFDTSHPPLERVLSALPLARLPSPGSTDFSARGIELLYSDDRYMHNLAAARRANLLFLALTLIATGWWASRVFGSRAIALIAVAVLGSIPPLLGHAGVATTDMACTATVALALVIFDRWLTAPSAARAAALGFAIGLGMLSKFSFIVFFGSGAIVLLLLRRPRVIALLRAIAIAALIAMLLVWAGYRFSVGKFADTNRFGKEMAAASVPAPLSAASVWIATNVPIPAPAFFAGLASVRGHNAAGHLAYLLGRYSTHGWWYYFPVVLFFKTPIPFWIFVAWGTAALIRERNREGVVLIVIAAAMMLAVMPSSINIGVRHVLPVYAPLAIIAAYGIVSIARSTRDAFGRAMLAALLLWLFVGVAAIHPDYLAWFNEFAGPNPERIASDSNLDWGQDVLRLRNAARRLHVDVLHAAIISTVMLDHHGVTAVDLAPFQHTAGWVALSESALVVQGQHGEYRWLNLYRPVRRVGKTIRLYYIP